MHRIPIRTCQKCHQSETSVAFFSPRIGDLDLYCKQCHYALEEAQGIVSVPILDSQRPSLGATTPGTRRCAQCKCRKFEADMVIGSKLCQDCTGKQRTRLDDASRKHLKRLRDLGLDADKYLEMFQAQQGRCAICQREQPGQRLTVDHSNKTGKVRALLCSGCNLALSHFEDDPVRLRAAAKYIERHCT